MRGRAAAGPIESTGPGPRALALQQGRQSLDRADMLVARSQVVLLVGVRKQVVQGAPAGPGARSACGGRRARRASPPGPRPEPAGGVPRPARPAGASVRPSPGIPSTLATSSTVAGDVDQLRQDRSGPAGRDAGAGQDQRHPDRGLPRHLLVPSAVVAEHLAVIGGEDDDGPLGFAAAGDRCEQPPDPLVDPLDHRRVVPGGSGCGPPVGADPGQPEKGSRPRRSGRATLRAGRTARAARGSSPRGTRGGRRGTVRARSGPRGRRSRRCSAGAARARERCRATGRDGCRASGGGDRGPRGMPSQARRRPANACTAPDRWRSTFRGNPTCRPDRRRR